MEAERKMADRKKSNRNLLSFFWKFGIQTTALRIHFFPFKISGRTKLWSFPVISRFFFSEKNDLPQKLAFIFGWKNFDFIRVVALKVRNFPARKLEGQLIYESYCSIVRSLIIKKKKKITNKIVSKIGKISIFKLSFAEMFLICRVFFTDSESKSLTKSFYFFTLSRISWNRTYLEFFCRATTWEKIDLRLSSVFIFRFNIQIFRFRNRNIIQVRVVSGIRYDFEIKAAWVFIKVQTLFIAAFTLYLAGLNKVQF